MDEKKELSVAEYLRAKARMTNADGGGICSISCRKCPLDGGSNGKGVNCVEFESKFPEAAEKVVREWVEKHPFKTLCMDFFEKFPDAEKIDGKVPYVCAMRIYPGIECIVRNHRTQCEECWDRPLEV